MSNKLLVFVFFMFMLPFAVFTYTQQMRNFTQVSIPEVGEISPAPTEVIPRIDDRDMQPKGQPARIGFVGDVLLARHVEYHMSTQGADYPYRQISTLFSSVDAVVGNFESAILENHIKTPSLTTRFSVDTQYLSALSLAKFSHMSVANNHSFDYGAGTFTHTLLKLQEAGMQPFGHPQRISSSSLMRIESGDYIIGMMALNQVFATVSIPDVTSQFVTLASTSDYQIAYIHWGDEYILKHNTTQETLAKKLINIGFDAVIGHHPHVTQDIQIYNNKPIFYSLGNFIFDQYFSVDVQQGLALTLELSSSSASYEIIPVSSEGSRSQPYKMAPEDSTLFLKNLARRSDPLYVSNIQAGKLILPFTLATLP